MKQRFLALLVALAVAALAHLSGQIATPAQTKPACVQKDLAKTKAGTIPRTPDGHPDLPRDLDQRDAYTLGTPVGMTPDRAWIDRRSRTNALPRNYDRCRIRGAGESSPLIDKYWSN